MKYTIAILLILSFFISGCATTSTPVLTSAPLPPPPPVYAKGVYHAVLRGQTLWRIAKAYDVDIVEIIEANNIADPSKIETSQAVFIPGAFEPITGELKAPPPKSKKGYIWPIEGRIISYYGSKRDNVANKGIDIEAAEGQIVVAARSGKVVFCDEKVKGLGKVIIIDHGDSYSTLYAHNSANLVNCGDYITQNQPVARAGKTGRANVPMVHFQVRRAHKPQNPFYYLP